MDSLDSKILPLLMANGRITWAELGHSLGLSAPAAADRVRRLEERGVIKSYTALVDAEAAGYSLTAFVLVTLSDQRKRNSFHAGIRRLDQVVECHHIAGDGDFLLKVRCRGTRDLDRLLIEELKGKMGIAHTRTTIVLGTVKETPNVPVDSAE